ncbi:DUF2793 domain-containing protein [Aestuariivirga litoralis]|uniref:DUF2793 domain-containing protein n=1 Tax=Aestuariivirga litoralis TaxID=2650924 RepID=UPI0018C45D2A|nr:DUF2793 domain-containing protein [Aestuariivirga litoralis]MBG1232230.1 DUF2793 domain-containing protein [Aestuariivirga litoralis]
MSNSPNLNLPLIEANQAQKHLPHNDAVALIDGLLQLRLVSRGLNAPPGSFAEGDRFLIGTTPTGDWAGKAGLIALRDAGLWVFLTPRAGFLAWIVAESTFIVFDGTAWLPLPFPQSVALLGVNATPDATNKLSVNSSAVLLNNVGNGMQLKLNKNAVGDTASLLFQTSFSGRAEMGTTGDDGFHIKVSADGSTWREALNVSPSTGLATLYANPTSPTGIATKQYADALNAGATALLCARSFFMN